MNPDSTMLVFANPHSVFTGVIFLVAILTVLGIIIYIILTRDSTVRPEFRDGFGKSKIKISKRSAFLIVFPIWLTACIWIYQSRLASKFYGLEQVGNENRIVWEFSYYNPHVFWNRYPVVSIPDDDMVRWAVTDDWSGKSLRSALMAQDGSGQTYRSFGVHRRRLKDEYKKRLEEWEIRLR